MPTVNKPVRWWVQRKERKSRWANEAQGGVPNQFYRNSAWRHLRERQLRNKPLCQHCLENKRLTEATVADHVKPIRFGGAPLDENNLMSLCKSCHARKSAKERHMTHWEG